jgi:hypothetical protein
MTDPTTITIAAYCRNAECGQLDIPKDCTMSQPTPDEVVLCGECGLACEVVHLDEPGLPRWPQP